MKRRSLRWIKCVIAGLLGGFLGWQWSGNTAPSRPMADISIKPRIAAQASVPQSNAIDQIRESDTLRERLRMTMDLAESIPFADIDSWLEGGWFHPGDGYEMTLFNRILTDRRSQEAPDGQVDPTPAAMLERFLEKAVCGLPENEASMVESKELFALLAEKDPASLEAALGELIMPYRRHAEEALLSRRLATDFDGEIRKLWARPDGWLLFRDHRGNPEMLGKLLKNPAELPPSWRNAMAGKDYARNTQLDAAEFWWGADLHAAGFTRKQANRIRKEALSGIARFKPDKAIPHVEAVEFADEERKKFIQNIFASGGLSDAKTEKLLGLLKSEQDRQHAHEQLERKRR